MSKHRSLFETVRLLEANEKTKGRMSKDIRRAYDIVSSFLGNFGPPHFTVTLSELRRSLQASLHYDPARFAKTVSELFDHNMLCFANSRGDLLEFNAATALGAKRTVVVWLTSRGVALWAAHVRLRHRDGVRGLNTISAPLTQQVVGLGYELPELANIDYLKEIRQQPNEIIPYTENPRTRAFGKPNPVTRRGSSRKKPGWVADTRDDLEIRPKARPLPAGEHPGVPVGEGGPSVVSPRTEPPQVPPSGGNGVPPVAPQVFVGSPCVSQPSGAGGQPNLRQGGGGTPLPSSS